MNAASTEAIVNEFEPNEEGLLDFGPISLDDLDDAHVPVDIWFQELKEEDIAVEDHDDEAAIYKAGYRFRLLCGNYMPRRNRIEGAAIRVYSKNRESLQKAVEKYIIPFYKLALDKVTKIAKEGQGDLYYWGEDE